MDYKEAFISKIVKTANDLFELGFSQWELYWKERFKTCEACGRIYDYEDESLEVKQGWTHVCSECWNEEE